jgi:DNA-binding NtrC family response regulator
MSSPRVAPFEPAQLWQHAREPTFWLDHALRLIWVNRAWEELTGVTSEAVAGLTCQAHGPTAAGDLTDLAASFRPPPEALAGQPAATSTLILHTQGERVWRRVEFWPFVDDQNALLGFLGQVRSEDSPPIAPDTTANQLHVELLEVRRQLQKLCGFDSLIGFGPWHRRLLEQVRLAATSTTPILIVGETGTGRRQVARAIHYHGPCSARPIIPFDCEALPAEVLERELFHGEQPDARYSQSTLRTGSMARSRLALGEGSTLLVCEVLMLPRDLQARLVAALDAPIRLLATTACDPEHALANEKLHPELYFALTTLVVHLRPLRERREELPLLAQHLLERANQRGGEQRAGFSPQAISALLAYDWPGNLRELARVIDHAHAHASCNGSCVNLEDLPPSIRGNLGAAYPPPTAPSLIKPLDELLTEVERRLIETALRQTHSNKSRAADILGISRPRLYRRIKELNLPDAEATGELDSSG